MRLRTFALLLSATLTLPACHKSSGSSATASRSRIPGGIPTAWGGLSFDLPPGWTTRVSEGHLIAEGPHGKDKRWLFFNLYGFADVRSLDEAAFESMIRAGSTTKKKDMDIGRARRVRCGDLDALEWTWVVKTPQGSRPFMRWIGVVAKHAMLFTFCGDVEDNPELEAIAGSLAAGPAPSIPLDRICTGWSWWRPPAGGGPNCRVYLTLRRDMTFDLEQDLFDSTTPDGKLTLLEKGTWSLDQDEITFRPAGGAARTQVVVYENSDRQVYCRLHIGEEPWSWDEFQSIHRR